MIKNKIKLLNILKRDNRIEYILDIEGRVKTFFTSTNLKIEYNEDMSNVPNGIFNIPLITNILPVIWLTDSELYIEELDKSFYESIIEIKKGYIDMYPETEFKGSIIVKNIVDYKYKVEKNKVCTFFSGGVDSLATLINNLNKKPDLVTIWGSDIKVENDKGWANVENEIKKIGKDFNLKNLIIKSTFRSFINERELDETFSKQLKDGWWHGIQHGIGLIGHAIPYAYKYNLEKILIPGTHTSEVGKIRCASYPTIDEKVKYGSGIVIHDGFENNRQKKIEIIGKYIKELKNKVLIRVCWQGTTGKNCSECEKCRRTIMGLIAEGINPSNHGFLVTEKTIINIKNMWYKDLSLPISTIYLWKDIQNKFKENSKYSEIDDELKWILKINFKKQSDNNKKKIKMKKYLKNKFIKLKIALNNIRKIKR
ncbi:MAG: hypothetical protein ACRCZO_11515 [Cetobacterium sp.]